MIYVMGANDLQPPRSNFQMGEAQPPDPSSKGEGSTPSNPFKGGSHNFSNRNIVPTLNIKIKKISVFVYHLAIGYNLSPVTHIRYHIPVNSGLIFSP